MLPLVFDLEGREVLVLGAGAVGARKAAQLVAAGAEVHVISTALLAELPAGVASVEERPYRVGDLVGRFLVVSATADDAANDRIVAEAEAERCWLNVVDDPGRSSFYFTALARFGEVVLSVSTEGASPALAQELRDRAAAALPPSTAAAAEALRAERRRLHEAGESTEGLDWRPLVLDLLDAPEAS
jgi:precorrin-2 dehydrogenase/sirohydrochlorin ferrochelatase